MDWRKGMEGKEGEGKEKGRKEGRRKRKRTGRRTKAKREKEKRGYCDFDNRKKSTHRSSAPSTGSFALLGGRRECRKACAVHGICIKHPDNRNTITSSPSTTCKKGRRDCNPKGKLLKYPYYCRTQNSRNTLKFERSQ
jgi:hypothetical protein